MARRSFAEWLHDKRLARRYARTCGRKPTRTEREQMLSALVEHRAGKVAQLKTEVERLRSQLEAVHESAWEEGFQAGYNAGAEADD